MLVWWTFGVGIFLLYALIFGLCKVAGESDDWIERQYRENENVDEDRDTGGNSCG